MKMTRVFLWLPGATLALFLGPSQVHGSDNVARPAQATASTLWPARLAHNENC